MQFRNFLDDWYAKETSSQFDALKEALGAYPVEVKNAVCRLFPRMNQATVITSLILANCLGTNTNAIPLGSTEQAKAIMYYLIKDILKDKTALKSTLSVVSYALKKLAEYPSRATNTGTDQQTGVHLLQAIINKINGTCEIADTQAAAVCLGLPCVETSCHTTYVFIHAAIAWSQKG